MLCRLGDTECPVDKVDEDGVDELDGFAERWGDTFAEDFALRKDKIVRKRNVKNYIRTDLSSRYLGFIFGEQIIQIGNCRIGICRSGRRQRR